MDDGPRPRRTLGGAFLRFLATGAGAAAVDLSTYALLVKVFGVHALIANLVSRPMGGLFSFTVNKFWTFANRDKARVHVQFVKYWVLWGAGYAMSEGLLALYLSALHIPPLLAKPAAEATVGIVNFFALRLWVFREQNGS